MSNSLYTCNCDVIHEDIVNDVKGKMQPKDDYIQIGDLSPAESTPACRTGQIPQRGPDRVLFAGG